VNLLLLEPNEVDTSGQARVGGARARHLLDVLEVAPGDRVRIGLLDGPLGSATIGSIDASGVTLRCTFESATPPRPLVDLLLALPRPKVLRRLWAQLAALGVGRIALTNAWRVERNYFDSHVLASRDFRPLLVEGLQQARDTRVPLVSVHRQFRVLVEDDLPRLFPSGTRLVADPAAGTRIDSTVRESASGRVLLAVGPEGGWNQFERDLLKCHGFQVVGMGPRTLRSDTACLALLTLVHDAVGHRAHSSPNSPGSRRESDAPGD
jgi:RsmE family RNA methyltransferase